MPESNIFRIADNRKSVSETSNARLQGLTLAQNRDGKNLNEFAH
jgi:hypothetical protein